MKLSQRKLVTIITEASIEKELAQRIEGLGVSGYTVTDARGKGHYGERNSSWGLEANIRVEVVCDEKTSSAIAEHLSSRFYKDYAMIIFVSDVAVLRPERF